MVRIIRWLEKQKVPLDSSVLDIGTGNGVLLIELVSILQSFCFCNRIGAQNSVLSSPCPSSVLTTILIFDAENDQNQVVHVNAWKSW